MVSLLQLDRIWNLIPKANKPNPKKPQAQAALGLLHIGVGEEREP